MPEYTLKQMTVDIQHFQGSQRERLLAEQFGNVGSHSVGFLLSCIIIVMCSLADIVCAQLFSNLIYGDVSFDVLDGCLL